MTVWQLFVCAGFALLIMEIFMPFTFFLSMAIGAFLTAIIAAFTESAHVLVPSCAILSVVSLLIFKPFLAKYQRASKEQETGIEGQYIGKNAQATKTITQSEGAISIYGERWEARTLDDQVIEEGSKVEIVKNESLIMYVKKA